MQEDLINELIHYVCCLQTTKLIMKLKIIFFSTFMCLCFFVSFAGPKRTDRRQLAVYMENRNYDNAIVLLKNILSEYPEDEEMNYLLGRCYFESSIYDLESIKTLKHCVEIVKHDDDMLIASKYFLARAYHANLKFDKAISILENLKKEVPRKDKEMITLVEKRLKESLMAKKICAIPANVKVTNLSALNTKFDDYNVNLSLEENLIFPTARIKTKGSLRSKNGKYAKKIYYSEYINSMWQKGQAHVSVANLFNCECLFFSNDGNTMLFSSSIKSDTEERYSNIYIINKKDGVWSDPEELSPNVNSGHADSYPFLSDDGNSLYFSSNRPSGSGGFDLYVSKKTENGKWSLAKNLGKSINTKGNDISPSIYGDALYFSSNGLIGLGGYDIYKTSKKSEKIWSKPVNMGSPYNSVRDDASFILSFDRKRAFVSSSRHGSKGGLDIYELDLKDKAAYNEFAVIGFIGDMSKDRFFGDYKIVIKSDGEQDKELDFNPLDGRFVAFLKADKKYYIDFIRSKYETMNTLISIPTEYYNSKNKAIMKLNRVKLNKNKGEYNNNDFSLNISASGFDTAPELPFLDYKSADLKILNIKKAVYKGPRTVKPVVKTPVVATVVAPVILTVKKDVVTVKRNANHIVFEKEVSKMTILEALAFRNKYALKREEFYTVQLAAYSYHLSANEFGSLTDNLSVIKGNDGNYKYIYGKYKDVFEAKSAMDKIDKETYPDAFLRIIKDGREGKIIRMRD